MVLLAFCIWLNVRWKKIKSSKYKNPFKRKQKFNKQILDLEKHSKPFSGTYQFIRFTIVFCLLIFFIVRLLLRQQWTCSGRCTLCLTHRCLRLSEQLSLGRNQNDQTTDDQCEENRKSRNVEIALGTEQAHAVLQFQLQMSLGCTICRKCQKKNWLNLFLNYEYVGRASVVYRYASICAFHELPPTRTAPKCPTITRNKCAPGAVSSPEIVIWRIVAIASG